MKSSRSVSRASDDLGLGICGRHAGGFFERGEAIQLQFIGFFLDGANFRGSLLDQFGLLIYIHLALIEQILLFHEALLDLGGVLSSFSLISTRPFSRISVPFFSASTVIFLASSRAQGAFPSLRAPSSPFCRG